MKRTLLFAAMILISAPSLFAQQELYGRSVRLGFKVDPVFMNNLSPRESYVDKDGSSFGVNYGLMADIMFHDGNGAFATGLEVVHAGSKLKYAENGLWGTGNYKMKLQYLQIPLSVKLATNPMDNGIKFWGQFGTYTGALLGARADFSGGESPDKSNEKILKQINKVNIGLLVGAGIQYPIADKTDVVLGIGFENGFTDVTTNKKWNDGNVHLNRWALRLGVFF
jgi:opacity protein-like surface antigen